MVKNDKLSISLVEKYRPFSFKDIVGQDEAIQKLRNFVYGKSKKKAVLLYGPPGTGKTSLAFAASNELGAELFELNASDFRDKTRLQEVLRPAIEQRSLTKKAKIILVDEADGISGVDRGGLSELISLIEMANCPIIITANDAWSSKLSDLRKQVDLIQVKEVPYTEIKNILISILKKENLFVANDLLTQIAVKCKGDLRAAINDLQTAVRLKDFAEITFDERNKEVDIFNALKLIFKAKPSEETLKVFEEVNMPLDDISLWVEENLPLEYKGQELVKAIDRLCKADLFKGRIYKQQYWRFLVYQSALLSYGISASKKDVKTGFTSYKKPSRILKIWLANRIYAHRKSISEKYAHLVHIGGKRAAREFPVIRQIINSSLDIQKQLKLTEEELAYLKKD